MNKDYLQPSIVLECPACASLSFEPFCDFGLVPRSGSFLSSSNLAYNTANLTFEFCSRCALIRQRWTQKEIVADYSNVSRTTSHRMPGYVGQVLESLREYGISPEELVIEVGANDGALLDRLSQAHYSHKLGIEPSISCASFCSAKGHLIENVHLNQQEGLRIRDQYGPAKMVLCRHTLEHVPYPLDFLIAMRSLMHEDGLLFVEVPESRSIIYDLHGHELWDEHLHCFTSENLMLLMHRAGFLVEKAMVLPHRGAHNILTWCRIGSSESKAEPTQADALNAEEARRFAHRWSLFSKQILIASKSWPRPIACLGASHPQSNFLLFTGLGRIADMLVDDDASKRERFVPLPQPVPVVSTERIIDEKFSGTILTTAFGYADWVDRLRGQFALSKAHFVEPYDDIC